jgi:hypothetical protein
MERIQTKFAWALVVALSLLVVATLAGVVRGGPLDPPGPPGSTQENLLYQPANCAGFPITITQSGSYKLAQNISMPPGCAKNGIAVDSFNVTLDLQGFELVGVTGALSGINATGSNLTVRNGTIRDWPTNAILGLWGSVIDDVRATRNGTNGIGLGDRSRVTNCLVEDAATGYGISVGHDSVVEDCTIRGSGGIELVAGDRAVIEDCVVNGDTTAGAPTGGNGVQLGIGSSLSRCTVTDNGGNEIQAGDGSTVEDCVADGAGAATGNGVFAGKNSIVRGCVARNNGDFQINTGAGALVEDCVADGGVMSFQVGILTGPDSVIRGCVVSNNNEGIRASDRTLVEGNKISKNGNCAFCLGDTGLWVGGSNVTVRDNDFVDNLLADISLAPNTTGTVIRDNIVTAPSGSCVIWQGIDSQYTMSGNSGHRASC